MLRKLFLKTININLTSERNFNPLKPYLLYATVDFKRPKRERTSDLLYRSEKERERDREGERHFV